MSGNKGNTIHFLSASDRVNYGDLLFPIIFQKFAEDKGFKIEFYNYGIVKSDLTGFGALPTESYLSLLQRVKRFNGGKLVVGGGEVFFADWNTLYSFINPLFFQLKKYRIIQKLNIPKLLLSKNKVEIPFCPSNGELKNEKLNLYFSSVGGTFSGDVNSDKNIKLGNIIKAASLLSVRDKRTMRSMEKHCLNAKLIPDSAIIMSDYFEKDALLQKISKELNEIDKKYIFLQIGNFKGPQNLEKFAVDLKMLSDKMDLKIVLCPIGKAAGHEDHVILQRIKSYEDSFIFIDPKSIYDIMYLISNSSLYLGTSLHGLITAQSFSVPFIGLNKKLIKVSSYIKTWVNESMECLPFDDISKAESIFNEWDSSSLNKRTTQQKQLVSDNLSFILSDGEK